MKGCKYCRMEDNGDFGGDLKPLGIINLGWKPEAGDFKAVTVNGYKNAFIATHLMEISIMRDALSVCINGEYEMERKIRYCPMCGRDLQEGLTPWENL